MTHGMTNQQPTALPRLRLYAAAHRLAALGASGTWGAQMVPAVASLDCTVSTGLSRERRCAEAIRLLAATTPLRLEPDELLAGASLQLEARSHRVPVAAEDSISHITVDYGVGLRIGYNGIRQQLHAKLTSGEGDLTARDFWESQLICLKAACHWHDRYRALLRERIATSSGAQREHYARVLAACAEVPERTPQSFHEAVQALWFMWEFQRVCGNWTGLGRLDELLGPHLESDLAAGVLTHQEAREILAHFLAKGTEWRNRDHRGSGDAQNYQNIILAGVDAQGREVTNTVTYLVLDIIEELRLSEFPITVRVNCDTPDALWRRTAEVMRLGGGVVAIYNENVILTALQKLGLPLATARLFTNDGCWEILIPGRTHFKYLPFDCVQLLQETLGVAAQQTPDFADFEALYAHFMDHLRGAIEARRDAAEAMLADPGRQSHPSALLCLFMPPCVERGRGYFNGGPEYDILAPHAGGIVDVADSLLVLQDLVYEQRELTLAEFVAILRDDWEGHEKLRRQVRQAGRGYGNDNPDGDAMLVRLFGDYTRLVREAAMGAPFLFPAGISTFGRQIAWAPQRLATPAGFRAGEYQSNNLSPAPGTDRHGPTAVLKSYCKLDFTDLPNGGPLELRLHPTMVQGEAGLQAVIALLRTLHSLGGFYLSLDVVDVETLRDAQRHPERYLNLSVRIAGWSSHFVTLDKEWQEMIIERTIHGK